MKKKTSIQKKETTSVCQENIVMPFSLGEIPDNVFYGVFLTLSLVLGVLLYSNGVETTRIAQVSFPQWGEVRQALMKQRVQHLVGGYPIDAMTDLIAKQNKTTASFLVGIAKKESNWGKRVPRSEDGSDCYNYWGYRGAGSRGKAMGHGCFASPDEAIATVAHRLDTLIDEYHFRTARDLVVWKCGFSCGGHSKESVRKWISDVGYYQQKIAN